MLFKNPLIIANWKANHTPETAADWINFIGPQVPSSVEVVLCPPAFLLPSLKQTISRNNFPVKLGAQDVSRFPQGSYTGEIAAGLLQGIVECCLVGHSERRKYFLEDFRILKEKVVMLQKCGISPIYFLDKDQLDELDEVPILEVVAYEPVESIGTGKPKGVGEVLKVVEQIKLRKPNVNVLYGGSVDENNVKSYLTIEGIEGALVGTASLDKNRFLSLLKNSSPAR